MYVFILSYHPNISCMYIVMLFVTIMQFYCTSLHFFICKNYSVNVAGGFAVVSHTVLHMRHAVVIGKAAD